MDRQRDWMLELVSATEDRRDVCKIEWSQVLLNHRPQEWILPHWTNSESRVKSAFVVPMGKWEFKRTPFGLSQAPAYFQLLIDKVLMGCNKFAMGYLDDIIIFRNNEIEHLRHIEEIFTRLEHFGLNMKREKCDFFKKHIQYLGHLIAEDGFTPLPEKLESI